MTDAQTPVIVINTITLNQPSDAQIVANLQLELVARLKSTWPGFLGQKTLIARDGATVATIETWATFETLLDIVKAPLLLEYRQRIQAYGALSPVLYQEAKASE